MCRSIKVLRRPELTATPEEVSAAARQFVRKVSGFHNPSKANQEAFEAAVREIAETTERLLGRLPAAQRPRRRPEPVEVAPVAMVDRPEGGAESE